MLLVTDHFSGLYLARWFTLTQFRSKSQVKVIGCRVEVQHRRRNRCC